MTYVLITPARDEDETIERTINSVVSQTIKPIEWVIVSDGSTDRTDEIILAATAEHPWIHLLHLPPRPHRSFAAVVYAIDTGVRALSIKEYDYLGLLDADVCFEPNYFEKLIECFEIAPTLGLAGGVVIDLGQPKDRFPRNRIDVPGAAQFFRRRCFEELGGLIAVPEGGWDGLTCAQARMRGYETRLLTDLVIDHLKPRNISQGGALRRKWQMGVRDYVVGYYPLFEFFKCLSRIFDPPPFVGSFAWWVGYCYAAIQRRESLVPRDLFEFLRAEQKRRLIRQLLPSK